MDYIEGLFLGKLWSDTDFENRRHAGLFILYGFLVDLLVLLRYFTGKTYLGIGVFTVVHWVILILLMLACPFINFRYYRMPGWGKALILIEKTFKSFLVMSLTVSLILPRIKVQSTGLQDFLINYLNETLEKYAEKVSSGAGSFATVMGVLAGGIHVVLMIVLIAVAALIIPGLVYLAVRYIQYAYDWVIDRLVIRRVFRYRR